MAGRTPQLWISAMVWLAWAAAGQAGFYLSPPQHYLPLESTLPATPDPVSGNDGTLYFAMPLLDLGGPMGLGFTLHYHSFGTKANGDLNDLPDDGVWWWDPLAVLQLMETSGTNYWQFQIERGQAVAFEQQPDGSLDLVPESTFGKPASPIAFQAVATNGWAYFLDPRSGRVKMFENFSNNCWRIAAQADRNGNALTYAYRETAPTNPIQWLQPVRIEDGFGRWIALEYAEFGYDWENYIVRVTDHAGREIRLEYEQGGDIVGGMMALRNAVDVMGGTNRFAYAPFTNSFLIYRNVIGGHQMPEGNVPWTQEYGAFPLYAGDQGQPAAVIRQTDAYGNAIEFTYDTNAHAVAVAWPDGGTNRFAHAGRAQPPVEVVAPGGGQTTFAVDARQRIAGMTDATGRAVGLAYDPASARLAAVTNGAGEVLRLEYAATEQVITNPVAPGEAAAFTFHDLAAIRYPDGTAEEFFRDGRGNVTSSVDRAGQATAFAYGAHGNLTERTAPGGGTATFAYDAAGRLMEAVDADGVTNRFAYDALDRATNVVDGAGNATAYEYDAAGRVVRLVHPDGLETLFAYDANGNRTGSTARDGAEVSAAYDRMDRVAATTNALGGETRLAYDAMGHVAEVAGSDGATNRYQYDHAGRVTNETRAGVSVAAAYDAEGRLVSRTSGRGNNETFGYDADGRLAAATNALGGALRFERDAVGRVTNAVDELGHATAYAYEDGRLAARTDAEGRTAQWAYDADGRLAVATDPAGAQTIFAYTPAGRLAAVTHPLGAATAYEYDEAGRLKSATDPLGRATACEYDEMGRVSLMTDAASNEWGFAVMDAVGMSLAANPLGGQQTTISLPGGYPAMRFDSETDPWTYDWDAAGRPTAETDPLNNVTAYAYDDFGRVAFTTNPLGHAVGYEYDADGNLARVVDELGAETRRDHDALGQVTSVVDRAGGETAFAYDAAGRLTRTTDPDGVASETDYDATGRPLVRRAGAEAWTNTYDAAGRLAAVSSPLGHVRTLRRDALGYVTNAVDAAGGVAVYEYDAAGRLVAQTDAEGRATAYEYDLLDGLARVTLPGGGFAAYERDALGNVVRVTDLDSNDWARAWTPMGRWLEDVDPLGRTNACERDAMGRLSRLLRADGSTVDVHYDAAGQVTGRVWSAGLERAYAYDAAGRLVAADGVARAYDAEGRITNAAVNGQNYSATWTPGGRLASVSYADAALTVSYAYDPISGRLASVSDALTGTQVEFAYDADGRLVRQTDSHGGTNEFTHDAAGRVTRIQANPGIDMQYIYDAAGRLLSETRETPKPAGALLAAGADVNQYDAAAQLATPAAAYDALGRRTADERRAYQWSPDGLLTNAGGVSVAYDAFGNVVARNGQPLACHPAIGGAPLVDDGTNWYVWTPGGALLYVVAQAEGHAVHHYRFDRSGHAIALVDTAGAVAEAYAYEPGGLELDPAPSALGNPFRFLGRYGVRAEGTNGDLYHVRARWYDARTRAFLSPEPLWPRTDNPHALNPYQYANADPINFADVNGRHEIADNDLGIFNKKDGTWRKVDDVVPHERGDVNHVVWGGIDLERNTWTPTKTVVKPLSHDEIKARFGDAFLALLTGTVVLEGIVDSSVEREKWQKQQALWEKGHDRQVNKGPGPLPPLAPPEPDEDLAGVDPTGVQYNWWHVSPGSREKRLMEVVDGGENVPPPVALSPLAEFLPPQVAPIDQDAALRHDFFEPERFGIGNASRSWRLSSDLDANLNMGGPTVSFSPKTIHAEEKAASAIAAHLGRGNKRQVLADKVVEYLDKNKKKEIRLSGDWEGGEGSLDVKPFHLGQ